MHDRRQAVRCNGRHADYHRLLYDGFTLVHLQITQIADGRPTVAGVIDLEDQLKSAMLRFLGHPNPLRAIVQKTVQHLSLFSYRERLEICAVERPHYGHCIFEAARLACSLHHPKMSVLEFGCGGGNGLINAEMHIREIEKIFPLQIELYGFDTGAGLPPLLDYRDFPHYFKPGQFNMDVHALSAKLQRAKLVLGNVRETCRTFFTAFEPAPVGCIFHDLDFYSSTKDAFSLFDADPRNFLPRVFMYFDDIIGDNKWLASEFAGESLAIEEFNARQPEKKIAANRFIPLRYPYEFWRHQVYIYHDFSHPEYNAFVADDEQTWHEREIRLQ